MYTPKPFQNTDLSSVKDFIRHNGFGILVSQKEGQLAATHIPMLLSEEGTCLTGHISRGNRQWKDVGSSSEVLAIFNGPHAYISSSWYDHENVPTWNYIAVHVYGVIRIIEGDELLESLRHLVDKYEQHSEKPVSVEKMSPDFLKKEIRGIVGFEITITNIEAAYKLSQNRDKANHDNIIQELEKRGDASSKEIAEAMKKK